MKYSFSFPSRPDTVFEVKHSFWLGKLTVWVNGEEAKRANIKREFIVKFPNGKTDKLAINVSTWGFRLKGVMNKEVVDITPPMKWYDYILGYFPLLIVFIGGMLGAIFGLLGTSCNLRILRTRMSLPLKILASIGIGLLSVLAYSFTVSILLALAH